MTMVDNRYFTYCICDAKIHLISLAGKGAWYKSPLPAFLFYRKYSVAIK